MKTLAKVKKTIELTEKQSDEMYKFFAILETLYDTIDLSWDSHPINRHPIKDLVHKLKFQIGKQINTLFSSNPDENIADEYHDASVMASNIFDLSVRAIKFVPLEERKKLDQELVELFARYGIQAGLPPRKDLVENLNEN